MTDYIEIAKQNLIDAQFDRENVQRKALQLFMNDQGLRDIGGYLYKKADVDNKRRISINIVAVFLFIAVLLYSVPFILYCVLLEDVTPTMPFLLHMTVFAAGSLISLFLGVIADYSSTYGKQRVMTKKEAMNLIVNGHKIKEPQS